MDQRHLPPSSDRERLSHGGHYFSGCFIFLLRQSLQFLLAHRLPATHTHLAKVLAGGDAPLLAGADAAVADLGSYQSVITPVKLIAVRQANSVVVGAVDEVFGLDAHGRSVYA